MMSYEWMQDALVATVAIAAAVVVFRRVFGFVRPSAGPVCANCPSAKRNGTVPAAAQASGESATHPLIVMRSSNR